MSQLDPSLFVDTSAWIALALTRDPLHPRAAGAWQRILSARSRLVTSVPIVIETFTFLDRNAGRDVAETWRDAMTAVPGIRLLECTLGDLTKAWASLERRELVRLSVVDATSFVLMRRLRLRTAFAFDQHFAAAGFRLLG